MTQKGCMFKGQQKKKSIPPSRHGKQAHIRKGKRIFKPSNVTKDMDANREMTKFINHANEMKVASIAREEGGVLSIVKPPPKPSDDAKK